MKDSVDRDNICKDNLLFCFKKYFEFKNIKMQEDVFNKQNS